MSFKRIISPAEFKTGEALTKDLVAIGFRLAEHPAKLQPNIEDTLVAASIEGVVREDYRVLALLVDWLEIHMERVNADRLTKVVALLADASVKSFWAGIAHWKNSDIRMARLGKLAPKRRYDLLGERSGFLIARAGEDERFVGSSFRVPAKVLRRRVDDILSPAELAKRHRSYYWRVLIGPSYRADMWAALEDDSALSPAELARVSYGSFPTAWAVKKDWLLVSGAGQRSWRAS